MAATVGSASSQNLNEKKRQNQDRLIGAAISAAFLLFFGISSFFERQYTFATSYIGTGVAVLVFAYFVNKYQIYIRARISFGVALIAIGVIFFLFNDVATALFSFTGLLIATITDLGPNAVYVAVGGALACLAIAVVVSKEEKVDFGHLTRRQLLPYGVAAALIFFAYVVTASDVSFAYAIPATFVIIGVCVLAGLRRFTLNTAATAVLLICMLIFGSAA